MKPCSRNRKLLAWLALDALEPRKAAALRKHLIHCAGCRRYGEEISNVTEHLAAAQPDAILEASESFYRKVAEKLPGVESSSVRDKLAAWFRGARLNWRVALPTTVALTSILLVLIVLNKHPALSPPAIRPPVHVAANLGSESDLAPTIGNYQMIAHQSLDKLSELLARQGNQRLPPAPVYTASNLGLADAPF